MTQQPYDSEPKTKTEQRKYAGIIAALLLLATAALPAAAQDTIPPRPESQAERSSCLRDLACAAHWMALTDSDEIVVLLEPRTGRHLEGAIRALTPFLNQLGRPKPSAPAPRSGRLLALAAAAGRLIAAQPKTPAEVESCRTNVRCAAYWLAGTVEQPRVLESPRSGMEAMAARRFWRAQLVSPPTALEPVPESGHELASGGEAGSVPIHPRPVTRDQLIACVAVDSCVGRWVYYDRLYRPHVLPEPRSDLEVEDLVNARKYLRWIRMLEDASAPAPEPSSGVMLIADQPGQAQQIPPQKSVTHTPLRPETPEQIQACLHDYGCAAFWLAGRIDNPKVLGRRRSGSLLKNAWTSWHRALDRAGIAATGPAEPPPELLARPTISQQAPAELGRPGPESLTAQ